MHIAFHDCVSSASAIAGYSEYNAFAATNNIIVVYPESECWAVDWHTHVLSWNPTNDDNRWNTKDGLYARAIMAIACRVTAEDELTADCPTAATALTSLGFGLLAALTLLQ